jgi:predicted lipoprotein with Yx(FWY)xxD motif
LKRSRGAIVLIACGLALALIAAGCGGDDNGNGGGSTQASTGGATGTVATADNPKLGQILVDANGMTLYDFKKDKGGQSACYGACAGAWPPTATTGSPSAGQGALASKLGTTKRKDGTTQITYAGHPLYTYTGDSKPGDANGNDIEQFGAEWYALTPSGEEPKD